jgi:outer membrane protein
MKNGLLIWNVVLTLVAGYLLVTHFTSKKNVASGIKVSSKDSAAANSRFRIAYFEMDSVENNFQMVKEVKAEVNEKEKEYNNDLAKLDYTYQNRVESYRNKGKLNNDEIEKAQIDLKQLQEQLKVQKQGLDQEYQDFVMHRQLSLKTAIGDFLKEYNKAKDYSYIIVYTGDLVYYKDTAYDITEEVIKGLNEMYKNKKK